MKWERKTAEKDPPRTQANDKGSNRLDRKDCRDGEHDQAPKAPNEQTLQKENGTDRTPWREVDALFRRLQSAVSQRDAASVRYLSVDISRLVRDPTIEELTLTGLNIDDEIKSHHRCDLCCPRVSICCYSPDRLHHHHFESLVVHCPESGRPLPRKSCGCDCRNPRTLLSPTSLQPHSCHHPCECDSSTNVCCIAGDHHHHVTNHHHGACRRETTQRYFTLIPTPNTDSSPGRRVRALEMPVFDVD